MMPALRQFGMAIAISVISLGLVIGGLSLALSENYSPPEPTAAASQVPPSPILFETTTASATPQILPSETSSPTATVTPVSPTACMPPAGWIGVVVGPADTLESLALKYRTSPQLLAQANCLLTTGSLTVGSFLYVPSLPATSMPTSTRVPCGPPFGWVRYTVQQGDTLYHIATMYGITTIQLQDANCLGPVTTIHPGQLLWVPNRPPLITPTPGVTLIPTFETATEIPPTPTDTPEPTSTNTPVTPES